MSQNIPVDQQKHLEVLNEQLKLNMKTLLVSVEG